VKPAIPQNELHDKLALIGWSVSKIDYKNGLYVGHASSDTTGQDIERSGKSPEAVLASIYQYASRATEVRRYAAIQKIGAWNNHFIDQVEPIAQAYSKLPAFDEKAVPHWKALAAESKIQADAIRKQIQVEVVDDPEPYPNAQAMCEDVHKNKHFLVSRANCEHPIWSQDDNINFRIVHDVLGHCQSGGDFTWHGENLACGVHFPLVSPEAREALMTECLGQTGYANHFHGFGPQKVGLMSQFLHPAQEKEGEQVWVPHGGLPELALAPNANAAGSMGQAPGMGGVFNSPGQWVNPGQFPSAVMAQPSPVMQGYTIQGAKMVSPERPYDPNQFWTPPTQAPPVSPENDYIGIGDTVDNASKIDTNWQNEDPATQDRAIMNAFRVALLSPRKHLRWNAAHYQALMNTDPSTKAVDLWDILENAREKHNSSLGYPEGSHLAYKKQLDFLQHSLIEQNPRLSPADAMKEAKKIIFEKTKEFEANLPAEMGEASELRRYNQARKETTEWLRQNYTPVRGWQPGQMALAGVEEFADAAGQELQDAAAMARDVAKTLPPEEWPDWVRNQIHKQVGTYPKQWWEEGYVSPIHDQRPGETTFPSEWTAKTGGLFPAWPTGIPPSGGGGYDDDDDYRPINVYRGMPIADLERLLQDPKTLPGSKVRIQEALDRKRKMVQDYESRPDVIEYRKQHQSSDSLFPQEEGGWKPIDQTGFSSEASKYGAFMGAHLDGIEAVGKNIDKIREAAHEDLKDGGKGFIFRNAVMNMNLAGVNPKVASFVWLLLAPMSSELGIIDTHVIRGLRRSEKDMNPRDYYKFERMQRAAKDATGYGHMPLGMYHWGLWDAIRNPGEHSDHSPLRALDPLPWDSPDAKWDAASSAHSGPWVGPQQFESARGHMEQAANDFDQAFAGQPSHLVPLAQGPGQSYAI